MITHGDAIRASKNEYIAKYSANIVANTVKELTGEELDPDKRAKLEKIYAHWLEQPASTPE